MVFLGYLRGTWRYLEIPLRYPTQIFYPNH
jgi:hypothetical protein